MHCTKGTNMSEGPNEEPHGGWRRSAPFYGRLRNRRIAIAAFGTTYGSGATCPAVFDGDTTVIWKDSISIPEHFPSKSGRLWATRRLLLCTALVLSTSYSGSCSGCASASACVASCNCVDLSGKAALVGAQ